MMLPTTLTACAAAALIAIWLVVRVGSLRRQFKISHGDGGNEALARRMRAQLNYVENAPFVLLLVAVIEISGKGGLWLSYVAAIFLLARVAHAIGMDSATVSRFRMIGVTVTLLTLLGLAAVAVLIAAGVI